MTVGNLRTVLRPDVWFFFPISIFHLKKISSRQMWTNIFNIHKEQVTPVYTKIWMSSESASVTICLHKFFSWLRITTEWNVPVCYTYYTISHSNQYLRIHSVGNKHEEVFEETIKRNFSLNFENNIQNKILNIGPKVWGNNNDNH